MVDMTAELKDANSVGLKADRMVVHWELPRVARRADLKAAWRVLKSAASRAASTAAAMVDN
jgi:hypothetical protein